MINDSVPTFNPWHMSVAQLKKCIALQNMYIRRSFEPAHMGVAYLNNWRSDRVRMIKALEAKLGGADVP